MIAERVLDSDSKQKRRGNEWRIWDCRIVRPCSVRQLSAFSALREIALSDIPLRIILVRDAASPEKPLYLACKVSLSFVLVTAPFSAAFM